MKKFLLLCIGVVVIPVLHGCTANQYAAQMLEATPDMAFSHTAVQRIPALESCQALTGDAANQLFQRVADNNPQIAQAVAQVQSAEALARATGASLFPSVTTGINAARGTGVFASSAGMGAPQPITVYQGSVAASYEIDVWSRLRNDKAAALLTAASTQQSLQSLQITLNASAADAWFGLTAQKQLLAMLESQRDTSQRFVELTLLRFQLGQAPAQDLGRQKLQLLEVDRQLIAARSNLDVLKTQLALLMGDPPGQLSLETDDRFPALPPLPDPGLPADLAQARPDVRAAQLRLQAADRNISSAVTNRLPSLTLNASLTSIEQSLSDLFSDALWSVGAVTGLSLFDGGAINANIELAEANAQLELAVYSQTLLTALQEVQSALISNQGQTAVLENLQQQLVEADRVLGLTRDGYRNGQASYLDVLNALLSKQSLERQHIDARRTLYSNRVSLCRALGQPVGVTTSPIQITETS